MCFSIEASIVAGTALLPAGVYAVAAALKKDRSYLPLAALPLLFGVQQLCEAGVWLGLGRDPALVRPASLAFLFFALAFWPFWIPLVAAALEGRPAWRRAFLAAAVVGLGLGLACYVPVALNFGEWVSVRVAGHSIQYDFSAAPPAWTAAGRVWGILYLAAVCCPPLLSRDRGLWTLGLGLAASAVISHVLFWYAFASVWCFFSAALSVQICLVLHGLSVRPRAVPEACV